MKKIRNIRQLRAEQKKLQVKQEEVEQRMSEGWHKLKNTVKPKNAMKGMMVEWIGNYMMNHLTGKLLVSGGTALIRKAFKILS